MLEQLKQVRGSLGVKDYIAALTHLAVAHGRVHAFNGRVYACAKLPTEYRTTQFVVPGEQFIHAVETAGEDKLSINVETATSRLYIDGKQGFNACLPTLRLEDFPVTLKDYVTVIDRIREAEKIRNPTDFLPLVAKLRPIIADDASRPWANALRIDDGVGAVTNNVIIAAVKMDFPFPVSLPSFLLDELLRLQLTPTHAMRTSTSAEAVADENAGVALWLNDNVHLRSVTVHGAWPLSPNKVLTEMHRKAKFVPCPTEELLAAIDAVLPFTPDKGAPVIELDGDHVRVRGGGTSGAHIKVKGLKAKAPVPIAFRAEPLKLALPIISSWDLTQFYRVPFFGPDGIRGALAGVMT